MCRISPEVSEDQKHGSGLPASRASLNPHRQQGNPSPLAGEPGRWEIWDIQTAWCRVTCSSPTPSILARQRYLWIPVFSYLVLLWRTWQPTPVFFPGKSHGQRNLVGYSPWGRKESGMIERLHFHFSLSSIGEGNGKPLQYSCLENPRDRGAWWAAVYEVTQGRT